MRFSVVLFAALALLACDKKDASPTAPASTPGTAPNWGAAQAQAPAANPAANPAVPTAPANVLKGKIVERLEAPPYTYLKLATDKGEVWAAVPQNDLKPGAEVSLPNAMPMQNFESKSLKRTFELVYFGVLAGSPEEKTAQAAAAAPAPAPVAAAAPAAGAGPGGHGAAPAAEVKVEKSEKAAGPNGRSVGEVWEQRAALKDKEVVVRGTVVKALSGIMGKTWVHVRDGSGAPDKNTHDLTFTMGTDDAKMGQVVTLKGKVAVDKDFGAGYSYQVIVEDAVVVK
ncbi:MAG: nucleotide-binding protein [Deltaproteobacteria bacterium]|nr:nucleotide-binding protein [Deltaproteobacteria bacterium]